MAKVLVVDDNDFVRKALEKTLQLMGHDVAAAGDPLVGLDLALAAPPDLALLDYHMPGMDGAELLRAMRERLRERCPVAIFVTASLPEDILPLDGTVAGVVKKPFHLHELRAAVDDALRQARAEAAAADVAQTVRAGASGA
jgi:DNA-binding response OmpR family regulator